MPFHRTNSKEKFNSCRSKTSERNAKKYFEHTQNEQTMSAAELAEKRSKDGADNLETWEQL